MEKKVLCPDRKVKELTLTFSFHHMAISQAQKPEGIRPEGFS